MAKTYFPPKCSYNVEDNHFVTDGTVRDKVSGTAMAGILNCSPWSSPFQVACALLGLGREDISSKPSVNVGKVLETPLIRYADKVWGQKIGVFIPACEVFGNPEDFNEYGQHIGDHSNWKSDFEDEIFSGHVDGIVISSDSDYILEVKTSSNLDSWKEGVPEYYFWQIALYNHFICKKDKAYVVLGMVNEYTYRDPYGFVPCENNVSLFEMDIDDATVSETMDVIREWYKRYIMNGVTPDYDPNNPGDVELYEHLCMLTRDSMDVVKDIDRLTIVEQEIAEYESVKYDLYTEREMLKANIKKYLVANNLNSLNSTDGGFYASIGEQTRTKLDESRMIADGIDLDKYKITSTSKTFSIKKSKTK